jgi:drug/metabolite transporter, DME family
MDKDYLAGSLSLLLAAFLYSSMFIFLRIIGFNLPFFFQNMARSIFALLGTGFLVLVLKKWTKIRKKDAGWLFLRTLLGMVSFICFYFAVNNISVGTFYFCFYAGFLLGGFLIGFLMFKEKLTKVKLIALLLSFLGLGLIYSFDVKSSRLFILVSLLSGVTSTVWSIFGKKVSDYYSAFQLSFIDILISLIVYFLFSLGFKESWVSLSLTPAWLANAGLGFVMIACGVLIVYAFHRIEAQIGSLIMLSEIIFAILWGALFYKEVVSLAAWIGGILITSALVFLEASKLWKNRFPKKLAAQI